jgi:LuxR family maltose regulon positive regulatory protein
VEATIVCVDSKTDVQVNPQPYFLTLLQTRLQPPLLPADITARPRLNRLMQRGAEHKLLLVTAPAGYGKTTAVLGWVQQQPQPTAWLALDAAG